LKIQIQALTAYLQSVPDFEPKLYQLISYIELPLVTLLKHFTSFKENKMGSETVVEFLLGAESVLLSKIVVDSSHFERTFEFLLKIMFKAEESEGQVFILLVWMLEASSDCLKLI
jgi:hypothetical protein